MANERTTLLPKDRSQTLTRRARPTRCGWKMLSVAAVITLSFSVIVFLRSRRASVPEVVDHEFGVGFDLTSPYGTAAISYPNGTIVNVAKIDASSSYQEMMSRLSLDSSRHLHPPYNSLKDYFRDRPRQLAREARKAAGLPATSDVGELAQLILSLRSSVETYLSGRKISGAVATIPHLPALYQEDLEDAFEYAGLIYIPYYPYWFGGVFYETAAVYAANGFGLCSDYKDPVSCDHERKNPPHQPRNENVLCVSYTRGMLASTWASEGMGFAFPASEGPIVADLSLGWDKRDENPREEYYWAGVRDAIIKPVLEANKYIPRETNKILLHGDCALDESFRKVLEEAVESVLPKKTDIFELDPVYSAGRGAAEMAKQVYWNYSHNLTAEACLDCEL
ncbi:MAG: hypothetical protein M1839_008171 [Geoglossum umbratile]|nr:MAG: hypothetical protein M1839_008171 [Geoglossum umbratile]